MKKTLSIHLGRQLFIIEEDAFDRIQNYLNKLESSMAGEDGRAEILEDIEMRFAELLREQLGSQQQVVTLTEVNVAISSLGEVEEIADGPNDSNTSQEKIADDKKFYRDSLNGVAAGVAEGLASYFRLDPLYFRIGFFLLSFTGVGIPLYLLLWILLPDAKTPADRLRMQGKSVNVDTIREEFNRAANTLRKESLNVRDRFREHASTAAQNTRDIVRKLLQLAGLVIVLLSFAGLIAFSLTVAGFIDFIPSTGDENYISFGEFLRITVGNDGNHQLMYWGILALGFGGIILAILSGFRLITRKHNSSLRYIRMGCALVFFTGIICTTLSGVRLGREFSVNAEISNQEITWSGAQLDVEETPVFTGKKKLVRVNGLNFLEVHNGKMAAAGILIALRPSGDSLFHIRQIFSAHSGNRITAARTASHISHAMTFNSGLLRIEPNYTFPVSDAIRNQEVQIAIEVPAGKAIRINGNQSFEVPVERHGMLRPGEPVEFW